MKIVIELHRHAGKTETKALVDSEATENFIDHREVIRLRLGTKKLVKPLMGYNMDDTPNKHGHITDYVDLMIKQGTHKKRMQFLVSNLGENRLILEYPWLREINPGLDWKQGKIIGSCIQIHTLNRAIGLDMFQIHIDDMTMKLDPEEELHYQINRLTTATEMALKNYDPTKVNTEATIPSHLRQFAKVFSNEEAQRFPPNRPWDHHIQLKPNAPDTINGKIFLLSAAELDVEKKYLEENLAKGYISECDGPYGHSTFYVKKKNGELRPGMDYRPLNKVTIADVMPLPIIPIIHNKMRGKKLFS